MNIVFKFAENNSIMLIFYLPRSMAGEYKKEKIISGLIWLKFNILFFDYCINIKALFQQQSSIIWLITLWFVTLT